MPLYVQAAYQIINLGEEGYRVSQHVDYILFNSEQFFIKSRRNGELLPSNGEFCITAPGGGEFSSCRPGKSFSVLSQPAACPLLMRKRTINPLPRRPRRDRHSQRKDDAKQQDH